MARTKGRPNKKSLMLEAELQRLGINLPEAIADILAQNNRADALTARDKLHAYLELLQYVYPKRKALEVDHKQEISGKVVIEDKSEAVKEILKDKGTIEAIQGIVKKLHADKQ